MNELTRRPSRITGLTKNQQLDIRAHQRTYQGAYIRTCIGVLSFSVLVMKLFSKDFASIGLVFQVYALILCLIGYFRGSNMDLYFVTGNSKTHWHYDNGDNDNNIDKFYFQTSGHFVLILSSITISCFIVLLVLLART